MRASFSAGHKYQIPKIIKKVKKIFLSIILALKNLQRNTGRTVLTLVGVVIGIMSVIVVMSSGEGVKSYVLGQFDSYGTDTIQIETKVPALSKTSTANATNQAQGVNITTLKIADAEAIKRLANVETYAAGTIGQELVSYRSQSKRALLFGMGADAPKVDTATKVAEGAFYTEKDDAILAQFAVIGADVKEALFGQEDALGKDIRIKNLNFKVIGVLERRGAVTFFNYDDLIYIPVRTLQKKILGVDYVRFITVKVENEALVDVTAVDITDVLRSNHNISDPSQDDFAVTTIVEAQKLINDVFGTITILLLALTSISLVVGGVGIMNVMYVAVVERTFEIGLRKAVGARSRDILSQFLLEAVIITLLGGLVGVALGYVAAFSFGALLGAFGFDLALRVTGSSVWVATAFSVCTGIVFGFYPAWKASKLSPMEALRKE